MYTIPEGHQNEAAKVVIFPENMPDPQSFFVRINEMHLVKFLIANKTSVYFLTIYLVFHTYSLTFEVF